MHPATAMADRAPIPDASDDHTNESAVQQQTDPVAVAEQIGRPRTATTTAEIDSTINHPGSVKINVEGAFIVDQGSNSPTSAGYPLSGRVSPDHHQTKDIRLPNHTAVVSHVAIDVSRPQAKPVSRALGAFGTLGGRLRPRLLRSPCMLSRMRPQETVR